MENQETVEIMAKGRLKLAAAALAAMAAVGLTAEYMRSARPLAEAMIVYQHDSAKQDAAADVKPLAEAKAEVAVEAKAEGAAVVETAKAAKGEEVSAEAFAAYLQDISARAKAVEKPESALGKIILPKAAEEAPVEEVAAEEVLGTVPEIVVYDGEDVVEVVTEESVTAAVEETEEGSEAAEKAAELKVEADVDAAEVLNEVESKAEVGAVAEIAKESAADKAAAAEPVVNTAENDIESIETEEETGAVDMMKDIIAREQKAAEKK